VLINWHQFRQVVAGELEKEIKQIERQMTVVKLPWPLMTVTIFVQNKILQLLKTLD